MTDYLLSLFSYSFTEVTQLRKAVEGEYLVPRLQVGDQPI